MIQDNIENKSKYLLNGTHKTMKNIQNKSSTGETTRGQSLYFENLNQSNGLCILSETLNKIIFNF